MGRVVAAAEARRWHVKSQRLCALDCEARMDMPTAQLVVLYENAR
jgi:hypothetical protein